MDMAEKMSEEAKKHLLSVMIPFWRRLKDKTYGGYYGELSYDLKLDEKAEKGCILNSRITWFFANVYLLYRAGYISEEQCKAFGYSGEDLLEEAKHGYEFSIKHCVDQIYGGIYWSLHYDGTPSDTTKHTYNQAFCIYALSSYYDASGDETALKLAKELFELIEEKCRDTDGYLEAFTVDFRPETNEKLSENGVLANRTMNTLLHVFEAYCELYRVSNENRVKERLEWIMNIFAEKVYNPKLHRQEVFFDSSYGSMIDLHSYGHDIETAWLIDRGTAILGEKMYREKMDPITRALTKEVYHTAFDGKSLANECEKGKVNTHRVWWVQAEAVIGFLNGYEKMPERKEYLTAANSEWNFIKEYVIDKRPGSEWFWEVEEDGTPIKGRPIVEPWKCPYHNGRMCIELIKRSSTN